MNASELFFGGLVAIATDCADFMHRVSHFRIELGPPLGRFTTLLFSGFARQPLAFFFLSVLALRLGNGLLWIIEAPGERDFLGARDDRIRQSVRVDLDCAGAVGEARNTNKVNDQAVRLFTVRLLVEDFRPRGGNGLLSALSVDQARGRYG